VVPDVPELPPGGFEAELLEPLPESGCELGIELGLPPEPLCPVEAPDCEPLLEELEGLLGAGELPPGELEPMLGELDTGVEALPPELGLVPDPELEG